MILNKSIFVTLLSDFARLNLYLYMRTPTLQYLYLQKPLTLILIIAAIALFPWVGINNGINFEDSGSLIAYIEALLFIGYSFFFLGKRLRLPETFTAVLVLITAFSAQSYLFCNAKEMFYALFSLIGVAWLFKWEERSLVSIPWVSVLCLSIACIVKGGIILFIALLILGSYLILLHYPIRTVINKVFLLGISSAVIPILFHFFAQPEWVVLFSGSTGAKESIFFYLISLILGLFPWVIYLVFSIFGINLSAQKRREKKENRPLVVPTKEEQKLYLFSAIVVVGSFLVFSAYPQKRATDICFLYPFISLFIARYAIFLTEYRTLVTRIFGFVLLIASIFFSIIFLLTSLEIVNLYEIAFSNSNCLAFISVFELLQKTFTQPNFLYWALFCLLLFTQGTMIYQLGKKVNIKILYTCIGLFLVISLFFNWILFIALG